MGQLWTDEMEEHWQAVFEEAANPQDYLVARDISTIDRLRGFARYAALAIRYRAVGGHKPWPLRQHVECANIDRHRRRQLRADPARQKEYEEWLRATATKGDPFEGLFFDDD